MKNLLAFLAKRMPGTLALVAGLSFVAATFPVAVLGQLPTAFQKVELLSGLTNSVNFEFAPDGRIFILDRYGKITIYKPNSQTTVQAANLDVFRSLEDGLLGIAFDPDFLINQYVYIHHSPMSATVNRVSRFTMNGDVLNLASEVVVLQWPTQRECCFHAAGDMDFDSQGNLYIATGDNTNHSAYATLNESDPNQSSENTSSNTNDLRGKILRIKPQPNGSYTIPAGNLFPDGVGGRPEIYVMGARNPYKIFVDKTNTDWLFWAEVGPDANAASSAGPEGKDEINLVKKAGNYGWPYFAGKNLPYLNTYSSPNFYYDPNNPVNLSKWNTGAVNLPPAVPSWLDFFHECHLAGPRYYFNPYLSNMKKLPVEFDKAFFYYDFNSSKVWVVKMDEAGNALSTEQMAPDVITGAGFIDLKIGPDGQLYILEYGTGCCSTNTGTGKLVRIDYIGIDPNRSPEVHASANVTSGSLPLTVNFSSAGTIDLDGDMLSYEWDFQSDGVVDVTSQHPSFTYTHAGTFDAQLRVKDGKGGVNAHSVRIYAGNNRATFQFVNPPDGGMMNWGDDISYHFIVEDKEDGTTANGSINCTKVNLIPSFGHLNHFHDGLAINQCQGTYNLDPSSHDTDGQDDIYMVFNVNYTDAGGLISYDQIMVHPKLMEAEFYDAESYTHTIKNTDLLGGGNHAVRALAHNAYIMLDGRNLHNIHSVLYRVAATKGGFIEVRAGAPTGPLLSSVQVPVTGSLNNWVNVEASISNPGGKHDLYFVFRNNPGDVNLFDLNYIEFKGTGVSVDNTPATINAIEVLSQQQLSIRFNEPIKEVSAEALPNYTIDNGISISSAVLQADKKTVLLSTSPFAAQVNYSLTVSNVENESGVKLSQSIVRSFVYKSALYRINAGGAAMVQEGVEWEKNQFNSGGGTYSTSSLAIANTNSDALYWSEVNGTTFSYNVPVPKAGYYDLALHFAEIYHGLKNTLGAGARVFNVSVEGGQFALSNYDIIARAGAPATAIVERVKGIHVQDGFLTVSFSSIKDKAKISALEVAYGKEPSPVPSITILSPAEGANVSQPFKVTFEVKNWTVGNGSSHIHKIVDGVTTGGVYTTDPITFSDLSLGKHTIKLELANADHTMSEYSDQVQVNVVDDVQCQDKAFPLQWTEQLIGGTVPYRSVYVFAADLDGDGFKDVVTGGWWYKNPGTPTGSWVQKLIGAPMNNMSLIHDFDGDGDMDIFGTRGTYISAEMAWAQNDGKGNFTIHTNIPAGTSSWSETFMAGAAIGNFQGVANTQIAITWNGAESSGSAVQLLTVPADPVNQAWTITSISPDSYGEAISAGDIDGDGDLDLFQGGNWLRNDGSSWTTFSTGITLPSHFDRNALADLDGNGRLDGIVTQIGNDREVNWFLPSADPTGAWTKRTIGTDVDGGLSLHLVDIDFDGDLDVLTGEWKNSRQLIAFENDLCSTGTWIKHILHGGGPIDHHDGAQAVDLDNDGDLDIISMGWDQRIPRIFVNNSSSDGNMPPVVASPIPNQQTTAGVAYNYTIPAGTFSDPNGDALSYSATLLDGNPLPSWLSFSAASRTLSGTPASTNIGLLYIQITASDGKGGVVRDAFDLIVQSSGLASPVRINAGGAQYTTGTGEVYANDQYFTTSNTYISSAAIAGTTDDALYYSERFGKNFSYNIPIASGTYVVRLHFAETYFVAAGKRVFNVTAEGQPVLTNYDVLADVGYATAASKSAQVSVTDGTLNLALSGVVDNAKVCAIELIALTTTTNQPPIANAGPDQSITLPVNTVTLSGSGTDADGTIGGYSWNQTSGPAAAVFSSTTVASPTVSGLLAGTYVFRLVVTDNKGASSLADEVAVVVRSGNENNNALYRINAGAGEVVTSMGTFATDAYYSSSKTYTKANAIAGTSDDVLYQSERNSSGNNGTFSYDIPLSNGDYTVVLHFAELYWTAPGKRVFDVNMEGNKVLDNYDIFAKAGVNTATTETFAVKVSDGTLNIFFSAATSDGGVNKPKVSAIEVKAVNPNNVAPVAHAGPDQTLTDSDNSGNEVVSLNGSGSSDNDGSIISYSWRVGGVEVATGVSPSITLPVGTTTVRLTVTDNHSATATDEVSITINGTGNKPPVAHAGPDQTLTASSNGTAQVTLNGSGSSDADGSISSYNWTRGGVQLATGISPAISLAVGTHTITLTVTDNAGASATDDVVVTVNSSTGFTPIRLNAGAGAYTTAAGSSFAQDQYFSSSKTYSKTGLAIAATTDDALYQSERYGTNFGYSIAVPSGTYRLRLHFAEIYFSSSASRVFDVLVEGNLFLDNYDIVADAGFATAIVKEVDVAVNDGILNLNFIASANNAKLSAIEVLAVSTTASQLSGAASGNDEETILSAGTALPDEAGLDVHASLASLSVYPNPFHSTLDVKLQGAAPGEYFVQVYDLLGKKIHQSRFEQEPAEVSTHTIDLSGSYLKSGTLYLVIVEDSSGSFRRLVKVLKE